jgi:hypothetical protein
MDGYPQSPEDKMAGATALLVYHGLFFLISSDIGSEIHQTRKQAERKHTFSNTILMLLLHIAVHQLSPFLRSHEFQQRLVNRFVVLSS